jgi:hypothetical protein
MKNFVTDIFNALFGPLPKETQKEISQRLMAKKPPSKRVVTVKYKAAIHNMKGSRFVRTK